MEHEPLVRMGADRDHVVVHRQAHVRRADVVPPPVFLQSLHHQFLYPVAVPAARAEFRDLDVQRLVGFHLLPGDLAHLLVVHPLKSRQDVVQFRDNGHQRHLPQDGPVPEPLDLYRKVAPLLVNAHLGRIVAVSAQKVQIHRIQIAALAGEVGFFFGLQGQGRHHVQLVAQRPVKPGREVVSAPIDEPVPHACRREQLGDGILHGKLVEVVVQQRMNDGR